MSINSMLDRFVSTAKERVIDTVSATVRGTATAVGHISSLIGNPLSKDFEVKEHIASFGPNLGWKVYNAKKKTTGQVNINISIFFCCLLNVRFRNTVIIYFEVAVISFKNNRYLLSHVHRHCVSKRELYTMCFKLIRGSLSACSIDPFHT